MHSEYGVWKPYAPYMKSYFSSFELDISSYLNEKVFATQPETMDVLKWSEVTTQCTDNMKKLNIEPTLTIHTPRFR